MKTYIYAYNNFSVRFKIEAETEDFAYELMRMRIEAIENEYNCQLPDVNCFDLVTMY